MRYQALLSSANIAKTRLTGSTNSCKHNYLLFGIFSRSDLDFAAGPQEIQPFGEDVAACDSGGGTGVNI
jgi:hypothetical protein